jgi:beta-phosphoglucomutase-like phosphatase (HAD superfamily)
VSLGAVIFDMDGVLVDSEPIYDRETTVFLAELGVAADPAFYDTLRGLPPLEVWSRLADRYELPQRLDWLAAESIRRLDAHFGSLGPLDPVAGAGELVAELAAAGVPLAVASSSVASRVAAVLDALGLARWFPVTVSGDEVAHGKPAPDIFLEAASRLGVDPAGCVVVEDSFNGVTAALAAGMRCVAYAADGSDHPERARADLVVDDLRGVSVERLRRLVDGG